MDFNEYMKSGQYLPEFMRDFHDQKDLFKSIHGRLDQAHEKDPKFEVMPESWRDAHVYTVDAFLWFMARHGYTLQRSRRHYSFGNIYDLREEYRKQI